MNAKKIMGAVLVALLVAALFIGAGSAATYFAYQKGVSGDFYNSVWQNGANTVTITNGVVGPVAVAGTYTLVGDEDNTSYFTNPTASYSAVGNVNGIQYIVVNGGTAYADGWVNITVASLVDKIGVDNITVKGPNGVKYYDGKNRVDLDKANLSAGTYEVNAIWKNVSNFTAGAPSPVFDAKVFTFTVIEADDATISASVDTVLAGDSVAVTIKGVPGTVYNLTFNEGIKKGEQSYPLVDLKTSTTTNGIYFKMPNIGEITLSLKTYSKAEDEVEIELSTKDDGIIDTLVINVAKAAISATVDAPSYFIGNTIKLTLSSEVPLKTGANAYNFTISGTNFKETLLDLGTGKIVEKQDSKSTEKTFVYEIDTAKIREAATIANKVDSNGKALDVGTYTIKIYTGKVGPVVDGKVKTDNLTKSVSVVLKQPFISIGEAPEVIVQGEDAEFIINAEATGNISAYIFGTNYFKNFTTMDKNGITQKDKKNAPNKFTLTIDEDDTKNMSAGQYFAVFQHPMYDGDFNIASNGTKIVLNETATAFKNPDVETLFNVNDRQTANAAQALCDALDSQNIDDMYVKYSFFVVGKDASFTISEIPTTVAQGETITISGVSTAAAGETVVVEMISTAFAAVPKETVGSAAFIAVTTEVAEDGTWEVTMDTSDLNVDEYSLSVACDGQTWKSVNINVVEAADKPDTPDTPDVPDTPDTPDTPTEPETPGFGALAALAGLGAVAVLLLRRE